MPKSFDYDPAYSVGSIFIIPRNLNFDRKIIYSEKLDVKPRLPCTNEQMYLL